MMELLSKLSSVVIFEFFILLLSSVASWVLLSCGKSAKYRFKEFSLFDYDSLPYLLSLFFLLGITFLLVALD